MVAVSLRTKGTRIKQLTGRRQDEPTLVVEEAGGRTVEARSWWAVICHHWRLINRSVLLLRVETLGKRKYPPLAEGCGYLIRWQQTAPSRCMTRELCETSAWSLHRITREIIFLIIHGNSGTFTYVFLRVQRVEPLNITSNTSNDRAYIILNSNTIYYLI